MKTTLHIPIKVLFLFISATLLLVVGVLMASRISLSRSINPILKRSPSSRLAPKQFLKSHPCPLWSASFSFCLQSLHKSTSPSVFPSRSFSPCYSSFSSPSIAAPDETLHSNPLLQDFQFPPFDVVEAKHVRPGIRALLKKLVCCFDIFSCFGICISWFWIFEFRLFEYVPITFFPFE